MGMSGQEHQGRVGGKSRRGFSLIELIAVLIMVSILSVSAAMSMSGTALTRQRLAAKRVMRDLAFLRERAMTTGIRGWATVTAATDTYALLADNPASPGYASAVAITDPVTGRNFSVTLNTGDFVGVDLVSTTDAAFGFDWLGRPVNTSGTVLSSSVTITLSGSRTITVQSQTGRVSTN